MQSSHQVEVSVFQKPKHGQYYCGDSYFYKETKDGFICALADGLGSGEFAKDSSQIVIDVIHNNHQDTVSQMIKKCNQALSGKRGAVLGILQMDLVNKRYFYSSLGNIGLLTVTSDCIKKRNIPQAGYLSGYDRPVKVISGELKNQMIFVLFSDGVPEKELSNACFLQQDVEYITDTFAQLYTHQLEDDTTIIAMKYQGESP